ncbi:flavodoxin domain-containing protein [Muricauda sp. MAR_2010_75]|jgi:menaquinone-dependent protoporphyrinogen IX oxidase|uniref:flavodoxin domain-containing protein n=1 Tax=Allomuricauda sp. MAR_2010_75 TaxID=1250232 RepID=UPI00055B5B40|nr:flavodoxin domain-containing protein [Muricauda sp. MAR_2010_75]
MKGAIFFSGKYGSTEQYANWISEATGLPVFDIKDSQANPSKYDFLILGSSIIYFKLTMRKWAKKNLATLKHRSKVLFSVSGAGPSDKLEGWVSNSFPPELLSQMEHIALHGRLDHSKVSWGVRLMLWIGSLINSNPEASKDERLGFDYMNKSSIEPIVKLAKQFQKNETTE